MSVLWWAKRKGQNMNKIRAWWQNLSELNKLRYFALGALALIAVIPCIAALLAGETWSGLSLNFGTEMAGAFVTFVVFDRLIERYEKHEEEITEQEKLKADLITQLGSQVQDVAVNAAEQLNRYGWLRDGTLRRANLFGANLFEANLSRTNLEGANLEKANLEGIRLIKANLIETNLLWVNLEGANLFRANLRKTHMFEANLEGACLIEANLEGAHMTRAKFNEETILPDDTKWAPETDMARFTDPNHPDFWRSDNLQSPAYQSDTE